MDDIDDEKMVRAGVLYDPGKGTEETLNLKATETINSFLGEKSWVAETYTTRWYYGNLLAWTVKCVIKSRGWKIMSVLGYSLD